MRNHAHKMTWIDKLEWQMDYPYSRLNKIVDQLLWICIAVVGGMIIIQFLRMVGTLS